MALERPAIEKKDFPVGRRGYDPAAVDSHLSMIADEVEALSRSARQRTESLAAAASEQVKAIVEAAEKTAADIQDQAEREAREIRGDASKEAKREREHAARDARAERDEAAADAQREREEATTQAREYVSKVSDSTSQMLARLDAMQNELGALNESLRTGAHRLTAELELLESEMKDLSSSASGPTLAPSTSENVSWPSEVEEPELEEAAIEEPIVEPALEPQVEARDEEPEIGALEELPTEGGDADETEGARLIALNMALNGTPREETDRYLAENFQLQDRGQLLDEVYASVES